MDSKLTGAFTLSEDEWIVLAFGLGVKSIFGFPKKNTPPDRESIINLISGLVNKRFIETEGENFKVLTPYRDAILRTEKSKSLFIRTRNDKLPDLICYCGNPYLLCEPMPQKNDAYRFEFSDEDALWERLLSDGYFPEDEQSFGNAPDLNNVVDLEDEYLTAVFENKSLDTFSPIVFWMKPIIADKGNSDFLAIVEHPLFRYILCDYGGERTRHLFHTTQMREVFMNFMKEANT